MAPPILFPIKKLIAITPEVAKAIEDYRFANRINSESEAIRELIAAGLKAPRKVSTGSGSGGSGKPARKSAPRPPKATAPKPRSAPATSSKRLSKEAQLRALREQGARQT